MRKVLPFLCIMLLLTSCVFGILYFTTVNKDDTTTTLGEEEIKITPLRAAVDSGIIVSTITRDGSVISNNTEIYVDEIAIEFIDDTESKLFSCTHSIGDILTKDTVLYTYKGSEVKAEYDCKIINIVVNNKAAYISLLNYDSLFVMTTIGLDKLDLISFDTKTILVLETENTEKEIEARIINFGYEVIDGNVEVQIGFDEHLLPGTPLKIKFEIVNKTESMFILKQMLMMDGSTYYVEKLESDQTRTRVDVEIGAFFDTYSEGVKTELVEIKNGLNVGDVLIIDIIE